MSAAIVCIGLATLDTILEVPAPPPPDGRVIATERLVAGGGPAATAAVAAARLGVATAFVGAVGDDDAGSVIRSGLVAEGVDVSELTTVLGSRSPQSTILVSGTERAIVHYPGTAKLELSSRVRSLCASAEWIHVDHAGYEPLRAPGAETFARVSVDGGNPIAGLDLTGIALYAPTEEALRREFGDARGALAAGAELVAVTRGGSGSIAYTDNETIEELAFSVPVVSSLGAGDVFHGALLARLVGGARLADALRAANMCAALSCRALDGRSAIPTLEELERILR